MLLSVQDIPIGIIGTIFGVEVPGQQVWYPRSFHAIAERGVGGSPNRSYLLTITDGTNTVAAIGADDAGDEPGTCEITWAMTPAANVAAGDTGVSIAPLGSFTLPAGYQIVGTILNAAPGDGWLSATAWFDFSYSTPSGTPGI